MQLETSSSYSLLMSVTRVHKDCFHVIGHMLLDPLDVTNESLQTGHVPEVWKKSLLFFVAVFFDLKRVIETIYRPLVSESTAYKWLERYWSDRTQRTSFNHSVSSPVMNNPGVPQRSVLGPPFVYYVY